MCNSRLFRPARAAASLVAVVTVLATATARGEDLPLIEKTVSYTLNISAFEEVLDNPGDPYFTKLAGWQLQGDLTHQRSMPLFDFTNTADEAEITGFKLGIGDATHHFESVQILLPDGVGVVSNIVDAGDSVEFIFTDFAPGKTVRFKTTLKPDAANEFQYPDYRAVMGDVTGSGTDTSLLEVTFTDNDFPDPNITLTKNLEPFDVGDGALYIGLDIPTRYGSDMVYLFDDSDSGMQFVPEPGGAILFLIGALFVAAFHRRWNR